MSHMTVHHMVRYSSTDGNDIDAIEAEIPGPDSDLVASEHHCSRHTDVDGIEQGSGRVPFVDTSEGAKSATALYDQLVEVAPDAEITHYRSPLGSITQSDLQSYFEEHPDERPTDDDGEGYIPTSWDPNLFVIGE